MDRDIIAGTESGTRAEQVERFPYRPTHVLASVAEIDPATLL